MASITWKGEGEGGAPYVKWEGHDFIAGKPTEVDDPMVIEKAKGNQHFTVSGEEPAPEAKRGPGRPRKDED